MEGSIAQMRRAGKKNDREINVPAAAGNSAEVPLPKSAALAGVIFSVLLAVSVVLVRLVVPHYQTDTGLWLHDPSSRNQVRLAVQLVPFSGIAFLWFIGVLRNLFGAREDRLFATVFFGSGLLFVASLFAAAAFTGALVETAAAGRMPDLSTGTYYFARQVTGTFLNVFGIRMAGVFMFSTSTIILRTGILPRWVAYSGYACAVVLLLVITNWLWIALLLPSWLFVLSARVLLQAFLASDMAEEEGFEPPSDLRR